MRNKCRGMRVVVLAVLILWQGQGVAEDRRPAIDQLTLFDVQPLSGGQVLYLRGDGTGIVRIVARGSTIEKRYVFVLPVAERAVLEALLVRYHFFTLRVPERPGIPDEARPTIDVRLRNGKQHTVAQWANDRHPDFDALYHWLVALVQRVAQGTPIYEGNYDPYWRAEEMGR